MRVRRRQRQLELDLSDSKVRTAAPKVEQATKDIGDTDAWDKLGTDDNADVSDVQARTTQEEQPQLTEVGCNCLPS